MIDLQPPQSEKVMVTDLIPKLNDQLFVKRDDFQAVLDALGALGYQAHGPRLRDGVVVYDEVQRVEDFPIGWTDKQEGGSYRVQRREDETVFGYNLGPDSWKRYLHPPVIRLWQAARENGKIELVPEEREAPRYAFVGVRACELHAIQVQDTVLMKGPYVDPVYRDLRENSFILAVNCGRAGDTCFCVSMETGPQIASGYDLAVTEVLREDQHYFVTTVGTGAGAAVMAQVPHRQASEDEIETSECLVAKIAREMGRTLDTTGLKSLLYRNLEHPRWEEVAERCLSCGNCTMVCPTCFCTTVEDVTNLSGTRAERWRKADSCFTMGFTHIHGGSARATPQSRYRQWLTHKLASWEDQFGTSGCVGCGRCITWCPVGIDITAEAAAIGARDRAKVRI